jgi:hypothetical protein
MSNIAGRPQTSTVAENDRILGRKANGAESDMTLAVLRNEVTGSALPVNVTIAYAAHGSTTDGLVATLTVVDGSGVAIAAVHSLEVWISDAANGIALTSTSASGALTATTGLIRTAVTAKKHIQLLTAATGIGVLLLVDSANTADERFVVKNPATGASIIGAATVAGDYEGG